MKKCQAIITLKYGIYPVSKDRCEATQELFGKAIKTISGNSLEDCENNLKEFLAKGEFAVIEEKRKDERNKS